MDVSASRDALRAAIFVFTFNALKLSHAVMASPLLIKLMREHSDLLSRPPQRHGYGVLFCFNNNR
jgi:hypothetical protein